MEQSKGTLFVENWLSEDEQICGTVTNILWNFSSPYPVSPSISNNATPNIRGSVMLTNKRLIFIEEEWRGAKPNLTPKWYSSIGVISLAERPPHYEKDWPYQAELTLDSGIKVVLETDRGQDKKGSELSKLLTKALFSLHSAAIANPFVQQMLGKQQEDEKRRRDD